MFRICVYRSLFAVMALVIGVVLSNQVNATELESATKEALRPSEIEKVVLGKDGIFNGRVYITVDGEKKPTTAKMTLSADGVVIDTVEADEEGNFAFASVEPGSYQMYGSTDGYVGSGGVDVGAYNGGGYASDYSMGLNSYSSDVVYDNYGGAPVQSFGSASCGGSGAGSCGGGCGGGSGLRRKLLFAGIGLGIVGIAGGFDKKDPASP